MVYLMKNYRSRVPWTSNVIDYLLVDTANKMVKVYEQNTSLSNQRDFRDDCPIPRKVLREALETLNLLFPPNDPERRRRLHLQSRPFYELGFCDEGALRLATAASRQSQGASHVWLTAIVAIVLALGSGITSTCCAAKAYGAAMAQYDLALAQNVSSQMQ
ncbi:hypothetical protein DL764_008380 [Monosporascus ibericus]|uniref:Uncharacterized protein n=1 Tax=Monosporascus ibericus TaxID=155417 RepID=A0A4Q4T0N5_9PEZI|nr:hypothetical protein DL764_008380 [Monosporascus ibericus]